jgi:hypothetical protein
MKTSSLAWWVIAFSYLLFAWPAAAEIPRPALPADNLQSILDRIHDHAASGDWKNPGFQDEAIEQWLDKQVQKVAKATDFQDLKLPVRLKDVSAVPGPQRRQLKSALVIGTDIDLHDVSVSGSFVMAEGDVKLSTVKDSVIVAKGAILISRLSSSSVMISGICVKTSSFDGQPADTANGSLIVSRGWVEIGGTAYGTLIAAPEGIRVVGRTQGAVFLNTPVPMPPGGLALRPAGIAAFHKDSRSVNVDLPLGSLPLNRLGQLIEIKGILHGQRAVPGIGGRVQEEFGPSGIVFQYEDRLHVAELDKPIVDEDGKAIESLRGWKLTAVMSKFALLRGSYDYAVIRF